MRTWLGVDIGGTSCKLAAVREDGSVYGQQEYPVSFDGYATPIIDTVTRAIREFLVEHPDEFTAIGCSASGQIDTASGTVIGTAGHIRNYIGSNFKQRFEEEFHLATTVVNDANCMILAEQWIGNARGMHDVVGITIGTGVGGGIIVNDEILLGSSGIAGEVGHMIIHASGEKCSCGNQGCYERYASTTALLRRAAEVTGDSSLTGRDLFRMAQQGNGAVLAILTDWEKDIASGLISLVHIFNPECIIIGGGVSTQEDLLIRPVEEMVRARIMPRFNDNLKIRRALLGNDAGMVGAVYYCMRHTA